MGRAGKPNPGLKAENTQRVYRGQLQRFAAWSEKSWLEVTQMAAEAYLSAIGEDNEEKS